MEGAHSQICGPGKEAFHLYFPHERVLGTSSIRTSEHLFGNSVPHIAREFYSAHEQEDEADLTRIDLEDADRLFSTHHKLKKYLEPVLESQRYGWFSEVHF